MGKSCFGPNQEFKRISFFNEYTKEDEETIVKITPQTKHAYFKGKKRAVIIHRRKLKFPGFGRAN